MDRTTLGDKDPGETVSKNQSPEEQTAASLYAISNKQSSQNQNPHAQIPASSGISELADALKGLSNIGEPPQGQTSSIEEKEAASGEQETVNGDSYVQGSCIEEQTLEPAYSSIREPNLEQQAPQAADSSKSGSSPGEQTCRPAVKGECYLIVHSVSKKHNIGMLLRSATAFDVKQVVVVGKREMNTFGSHGTADYVDLKHFYKLPDARTYLKGLGCSICGVEILEGAKPIQSHPFLGSTAFLLGNEGSGLSQQELEICDQLVYIPQYGAGTASLNVVVAASIVLHHYAVWSGKSERSHSDGKFLLSERPQRKGSRNVCPEDPDVISERRRQRDEDRTVDWTSNIDATFMNEDGGED